MACKCILSAIPQPDTVWAGSGVKESRCPEKAILEYRSEPDAMNLNLKSARNQRDCREQGTARG